MIDLTGLKLRASPPQLLDFGGMLTPALGGPRQRINRLGTRWAFAFETPNMPYEPDGRIWSARLARAKIEGALIWVPEPGLVAVNYGVPMITTNVAGGSAIRIGTPVTGGIVPESKWLSIIHDGRRYLHQTTAAVQIGADGYANLSLFPMLRTVLSVGDVVEIARPKMQALSIEGDFEWPMDVEGYTSFSFTLAEDE